MAETQVAPATIEINDAIFCTHFKEVVRLCSLSFIVEIVGNRRPSLTSFLSV